MIIGKGTKHIHLCTQMINRHGIISGATGTGKTVSLQLLAEKFSELGIPIFLADIKGDLSGLAKKGHLNNKIKERLNKVEITNFKLEKCPVVFWDIFGENGHPIRITVSEMGPLLLGRLLDLTLTQFGTLTQIFKIAEDYELPLRKLRDLQAVARYVELFAKDFSEDYGRISTTSVGAILRSLLLLETEQGDKFFGEPNLKILDLFRKDENRKGIINILSAENLIKTPKLYAMFLLWLLTSIYDQLPEVGDIEKPKFVFFFDEAHLLFEDTPKVLLEKIEQIVRLIRSKGVGIFFITQNPADIPLNILGQLGNRIQHALRSYTPKDFNAIKIIAQTFRSNNTINVEKAITQLQVGEALVSTLDTEGAPTIVEKILINPPATQIGPITEEERKQIIKSSPVYGFYEKEADRKSAFHIIEAIRKEQKLIETTDKLDKGGENQFEILTDSIVNTFIKSANSSLGRKFSKLLKF